jgi:hypothetical protein
VIRRPPTWWVQLLGAMVAGAVVMAALCLAGWAIALILYRAFVA